VLVTVDFAGNLINDEEAGLVSTQFTLQCPHIQHTIVKAGGVKTLQCRITVNGRVWWCESTPNTRPIGDVSQEQSNVVGVAQSRPTLEISDRRVASELELVSQPLGRLSAQIDGTLQRSREGFLKVTIPESDIPLSESAELEMLLNKLPASRFKTSPFEVKKFMIHSQIIESKPFLVPLEYTEVSRVLDDLHDFRDASGVCTSDWVLQVTVKQHDGKDDEEGEHIDNSRITKRPNLRLYSVDPDLLIRVTVKNLSSTRDISVMPVYMKDNGEEEPEDLVELKSGEYFELPFPLKKEAGEEDDGWAIKDNEGKTVLKLRFTLLGPLLPFANKDKQAKGVEAQEMVTAQPQQEEQTLPGTATISLSRNKTSNTAECARLGGAASGALGAATSSILAPTPSACPATAAASTPPLQVRQRDTYYRTSEMGRGGEMGTHPTWDPMSSKEDELDVVEKCTQYPPYGGRFPVPAGGVVGGFSACDRSGVQIGDWGSVPSHRHEIGDGLKEKVSPPPSPRPCVKNCRVCGQGTTKDDHATCNACGLSSWISRSDKFKNDSSCKAMVF
jgi:hypothetical protein